MPEAVPPRYLHFMSLIMFSCYSCQAAAASASYKPASLGN